MLTPHPACRFAAMLAFVATTVAAQADWNTVKALTTGTDVRIMTGSRTVRGRIDRITDETLVVTSGKAQETFTQQEVMRVSLKGDNHRGRNALIGLGAGAATGLIIGAATYSDCKGLSNINFSQRVAMARGKLVLGGLRAFTGM